MRTAVDQTFATNPDTPQAGLSLYRFSRGHGGLYCSACHGSTHAEYPAGHANDNITSIQNQGHVGMMVECNTCHGSQPNTVNGGRTACTGWVRPGSTTIARLSRTAAPRNAGHATEWTMLVLCSHSHRPIARSARSAQSPFGADLESVATPVTTVRAVRTPIQITHL